MIYRVSLGDSSDHLLRSIARKRQMSPEDLANSYILSGLENTKLQGVRYLVACMLTASMVLFGLWLLSISLPSPAVAPRVLHWVRELVFLFVPWPLTILVALWILSRSDSSFSLLLGLFGALRRIKLFGAEIELNEQTKRRIQTAASEIDVALREYKEQADKELTRIVSRYQIEQMLAKFIDSAEVSSFTLKRQKGFRCTIHIPDPIRYGRLYQLVDYCPLGLGRAREFSIRYGIIGKVWRTESSRLANDLLSTASSPRTHEEEIDAIMSDWGMDRREAETALKHRSYFCFPLVYENRKVGLLYMDAEESDSFDGTKQTDVETRAMRDLAGIVSKVLDDSATVSLQVEFD